MEETVVVLGFDLALWPQPFCMTHRVMMMHHHTKFGSIQFNCSEDIFRTKMWQTDTKITYWKRIRYCLFLLYLKMAEHKTEIGLIYWRFRSCTWPRLLFSILNMRTVQTKKTTKSFFRWMKRQFGHTTMHPQTCMRPATFQVSENVCDALISPSFLKRKKERNDWIWQVWFSVFIDAAMYIGTMHGPQFFSIALCNLFILYLLHMSLRSFFPWEIRVVRKRLIGFSIFNNPSVAIFTWIHHSSGPHNATRDHSWDDTFQWRLHKNQPFHNLLCPTGRWDLKNRDH